MANELVEVRKKIRERLRHKENLLDTVRMRIGGNVFLPDRIFKEKNEDFRDFTEEQLREDVELLKSILREIG